MTKKITLIIVSILFMVSCSGLLWDGDSSDDLTMTITINNPYPQVNKSPQASSRALALQGKYLYIELALINDQAAYDDDTDRAITGNGTWVNIDWGGHAIVALSLDLDIYDVFEFTFKDIPRGQALQARAILEVDKDTFTTKIPDYDYMDMFPVCNTYDSSNPVDEDRVWINISTEDLQQNALILPIRPVYLDTYSWSSFFFNDDYSSTGQTKPSSVGNTTFTEIDQDPSSLYVKELVYYSLVYGDLVSSAQLPYSYSLLHDNDGATYSIGEPSITYVGPYYSYKLLQTEKITLDSYSSPDFILSSTLLIDPPVSSWDISFGALFDTNLSAGDMNSDLYIDWSIPPGFDEITLEFKMIHIDGISIPPQDIDTIEKIYQYTLVNDFSWNLAVWNSGSSKFEYSDVGNSYFPDKDSWLIVLARFPGGEPFIYGKTQMDDFNV